MKKIFILSLLFVFFTVTAFSQIYSDSSLVLKSYKLTPFTEVDVINKYGNIQVRKLNTDSVKFEIKIKISTNDSINLENYIDNIDFAFTESSQKLVATTLFKNQKNSFIPSIKDFQKLPVGENTINVDYIIYLPAYTKLNLNNKYGDIFIDESNAELKVSLSNGNFYAKGLNEKLTLELEFGKGVINQMTNGVLLFRYINDFLIEQANSLEIDSKSSKISLMEIENLKIISKRDHVDIRNICRFYANAFFTNINILNLTKSLNTESKHCEFTVESIGKEVSKFKMNSNFDILNLNFKKNSNFSFNIFDNNSNIDFSEKKYNLEKEIDSTKPDITYHRGFLYRKSDKIIDLNLNNSKLYLK